MIFGVDSSDSQGSNSAKGWAALQSALVPRLNFNHSDIVQGDARITK